jgi:hypothetical protein
VVARTWASWHWHGTAVFAGGLVLLALLIPTSDPPVGESTGCDDVGEAVF